MTWKAVHPIVQLLDKAYANGVRVAKKAFQKIEERLERPVSLPKYCIRIQPQGGCIGTLVPGSCLSTSNIFCAISSFPTGVT